MKKFYLLFLFILLIGCSSIKEAGKIMRNEKTQTTDEFLIQKREPLVLPPDYKKIPEPGELSSNKGDDEKNIKKILKINKEMRSVDNTSSSVEDSIIEKIRK